MNEFSKARLMHVSWVEQLKNVLRKGKIPEVSSHIKCDLGKFIIKESFEKKHGSIPEVADLCKKHKQFHRTAEELIKLFKVRNFDSAEIVMRELSRESKELIFLITMVEFKTES